MSEKPKGVEMRLVIEHLSRTGYVKEVHLIDLKKGEKVREVWVKPE